MTNRCIVSAGVLVALISAGAVAAVSGAAQRSAIAATTKAAAKSWTPSRMPDGQPDLQGVWDFRTITPLERPAGLGEKQVLTEEEAADLEAQKAQFEAADPKDRPSATPAFSTARVVGDPVDEQAYNSVWFDTGTKVVPTKHTSLILDPADGRIPYTPEGRGRATRRRGFDGPEDRGLTERCILSLNAGPPMRPSAYNNNVQIVQAPGYVALVNEMIHDVRVIPLDGRAHIAPNIRQWKGDSRGRWKGTTLEVETINFSDKTNFSGSTEGLRVIERFTRVAPDMITYEFTVSDPVAFAKPWTAAFPLMKSDSPMFEYACHEGNYGLPNILSGARAQEKAAGNAKTKP
jgi:hypothetical protein